MSEKTHSAFRVPSWEEWRRALRWPYLTFTFLIVLTLAGSFVSYERVVRQGHPWLPTQRAHPPCSFCGMTRSFCAMSAGRVPEARNWNHAGPALYTFGWLWLAGSATLAVRRAKDLRKQK